MIDLNKVRLRRIELGYSQEYISQELGISQAQYSKLEAGKKSFDLQTLKKILEILNLESSQVMNFSKYSHHHYISQNNMNDACSYIFSL